MKNCVVVLANNNRRNELNNLIKDLNLYIIEGTDDFDLIIFHEKDFIKDLPVGDIGVLYEYSLAYVNPENRKESGQYSN